jgi:hypothetical protein
VSHIERTNEHLRKKVSGSREMQAIPAQSAVLCNRS